MHRISVAVALVVTLLPLAAPSRADAQVGVNIQIALPAVPPLVVIQPGVQVVEDYEEEVFYTRGHYWVRRGPHWYRAPRPGVPFAYVERRYVPVVITRAPPGHYKHWRKHEKERRKEERKAWKHEGRGHSRRWDGDDDDRGGRKHERRRDERRVVVVERAPRPAPPPAWRGPHDAPSTRPASVRGPHDAPRENPWRGPHDAR